MDIQAIRVLARTMDDRAKEIERALALAGTELQRLNWVGEDRNRFIQEWESAHAAHLRKVAAGLREAASNARQHALNQERIALS